MRTELLILSHLMHDTKELLLKKFSIDKKNKSMHGYCFYIVQNITHSSPIEAFRKMLDPSNSINKSTKNEVVERV